MKLDEIRGVLRPRRLAPPPRAPTGFKRYRKRTSCSYFDPGDRCGGCDDCLAMLTIHSGYDPATELTKRALAEVLDSVGIAVEFGLDSVTKAAMVEAFRSAEAGRL